MKTFTDLEGREWKLALNGWTLERVKEGTNVLLTELINDDLKVLIALHEDSLLLVSVLWYMIEDEAKERDVDKRDFAMAMAGDVIHDARKALIGSIVDFFDDPAKRRAIEKIVTKANQVADAILAKAETAVDRMAETDLNTIVSSGNLQELAASTRGPTP